MDIPQIKALPECTVWIAGRSTKNHWDLTREKWEAREGYLHKIIIEVDAFNSSLQFIYLVGTECFSEWNIFLTKEEAEQRVKQLNKQKRFTL